MKKSVVCLCALLLVLGVVGVANATILTSEISMDNGYVIYISTSDSVQGTSFGAHNDWPTTFTDTTTLLAGIDYYLHVYAYDQGGIAGFLGEFTLTGTDHIFSNGTSTLLTNTTDWEGNNTGWGSVYLSSLSDLGANGVGPWYTRPGIPGTAHWVWAGDAWNNDYAYFSTKISSTSNNVPVPEPATMLLFASGLAGLAGLRKRFRKD